MNELPPEWKVLALGEIAEVVGGGTPSRDNPALWGNDHYWITPSEVVAMDGKTVGRSKEKISDLGLANSGAKLHPPGTVLMTSRASIGFAAIAEREICTNQGFQSLRCREELDNWFALHQIRHRRAELQQLAAGSTFLEVSGSNVRSFPFAVPPLPEQKKIAEILSGIDSTIRAAETKLQKLITARSRVSEDLLETSTSEVTRAPLCDCIELVRGYAFKSEDYREKEGTRILRVTNIREDGRIDLTNNCVRISEDLTDQYNRFQVREDDLLLVMVGATTGKLGIVSKAEIPSLLNQNIWCLRTSSQSSIIQRYLHYSMPKVVSKHLEKQQGSARDFLTQKEFFKEEIEIPNLAVQRKIVQAMGKIDKSIDATKGFRERLLFLKSAISSDLLSGRKRVSI